MAEGDKGGQAAQTEPKPKGTGKYFVSKNSSVDEIMFGKGQGQVVAYKDDGYAEPVSLTEEQVKAARDAGVSLTEAKS